MAQVNPTAIIRDGARIADDVEIGPYCVIGEGVEIGAGCRLASHVVIIGNTTVGCDNVFSPFSAIGCDPQDLKYKGEPSTITIGSRNCIREYVTIHPGTRGGRMATVVGDDNLLMASSHVAHDCIVGSGNIFANSAALGGHVYIGNCVTLGGMVGVHQFCRVGDYVMLGAGSMVTRDVPPYAVAQGDRCKLRGVNLVALKRHGFSDSGISEIKRAYKQLFFSSGAFANRVEALDSELLSSELVKRILAFCGDSSRGLCPAAKSFSQAPT